LKTDLGINDVKKSKDMIMKRVFKLKMPDSSENKWNDWTNLS